MCKSQAEGGQRCAAHTREKYMGALSALTLTRMDLVVDGDKLRDAETKFQQAAIEYASTSEGQERLNVAAGNFDRMGDPAQAAMVRTALARGQALREANKATATAVRRRLTATETADMVERTREALKRAQADYDALVNSPFQSSNADERHVGNLLARARSEHESALRAAGRAGEPGSCAGCAGTGEVGADPSQCPACRGRGTVQPAKDDRITSDDYSDLLGVALEEHDRAKARHDYQLQVLTAAGNGPRLGREARVEAAQKSADITGAALQKAADRLAKVQALKP